MEGNYDMDIQQPADPVGDGAGLVNVSRFLTECSNHAFARTVDQAATRITELSARLAQIEAIAAKLAGGLGPFSQLANEVDALAKTISDEPGAIAKACRWEDLLAARQALTEYKDAT